jgi:hypothetical protein
VRSTLSDSERINILEECRLTLKTAKRHFSTGDVRAGKKTIQEAEALFASLRRHRNPHLNSDGRPSAEDTVDD